VVGLTRLYIEPKPELPKSMRSQYPSVMDLSPDIARGIQVRIRKEGYTVTAVEL